MNLKYDYLSFFNNTSKNLPNRWDILALSLVFGFLGLLVWSGSQMVAPYQVGETLPISLVPTQLPRYAGLTILRMLIALLCSLCFTLIVGTWAAKNKQAAKIIIPCIDILQSVPVLGFLSITIAGFIGLFPGSRLGPECAAIFAIFTAQAWNMCLSFYQSLNAVPPELTEATTSFQLSAWQRFWRLEVPYALPGLLWNMMLSMSGSWVFLVASESISVAGQTIDLPGIGSYLSLAIANSHGEAVIWAVSTMLLVILLYDQLFFRPMLDWSRKFTMDNVAIETTSRSWMTVVLQRTHILQYLHQLLRHWGDLFINLSLFSRRQHPPLAKGLTQAASIRYWVVAWQLLQILFGCWMFWGLLRFALGYISWQEVWYALALGGITALRVIVVVLISGCIWLPIGVWIGLNARLSRMVQPFVQFLAAFPANVLFPLVVAVLLKWQLSIEVGVLPLMLLGTQWYILFNVIAGTESIPKELQQMTENLGLRGWIWWKRLIFPGIFPYLVTGMMTAVGSAWNISVIAEVMRWGSVTLSAMGLGAYISQASDSGDFPRVAMGMVVMSVCVLVMNYGIWQPLYRLAQSKYRLS